ncbi:GNAT family N-acetyltransferase [Streptomyces sp. SYP-A7185]|uniref:GNAT family N-acetyltransferase n=1 Tax=Streptomyces sp. SYP-A7185 TaxID=3040076 RepID=UPI0038F7BF32
MERQGAEGLRLVPWSEGDFALLVANNSPEMTVHLGGPETEEQLVTRHRRYLALQERGRMFRIELDGAGVGSIGYWETTWQGAPAWETGWGVLPEFQGRGIAARAARLVVTEARAAGRHRYLHAFPSREHAASNGVCRKAGFTFRGESDCEYPKGHWMRCNDWSVDLEGERAFGEGEEALG